jgi:hypothetical protein
MALSSLSIGLQTSRHLRRHPLHVARSPGVSVIASFRSPDLSALPSSPFVGLRTSRRLRFHPLQVARPLDIPTIGIVTFLKVAKATLCYLI